MPSARTLGLLSEIEFQKQALSRGLKVSTPTNPTERYDLIVDNGKALYRVQVKRTSVKKPTRSGEKYSFELKGSRRGSQYTLDEVDYFALHIMPSDIWYIIPSVTLEQVSTISLYPGSKKSRYEKYNAAWVLMLHED